MVYIWEGVANVDWTGGDAIAIAFSVEEARKMLLENEGPGQRLDRGQFGAFNPLAMNPDHVLPLKDFVYYGPGGA